MRLAISCVILALAGLVHSQAPITAVRVGVTLRTQSGGTASQQRVRVVAKAGHTLPDYGLGLRARVGGTVYLFSAALDDLPVPTYQAQGSLQHWFSLVWTDTVSHQLPMAVPGHNTVFGTPSALYIPSFQHEWLGPAPWDDPSIISPPQGWRAFFLTVNIPDNYLLSGQLVSVQSYRMDLGWKLYASDENVFVIG